MHGRAAARTRARAYCGYCGDGKPIVQRVCFWSVIIVFSVGTVVNLGYALFPRESTTFPPIAAVPLIYAPVAFLVVIIVIFGMVRRPKSPDGAR